MRTGLVLKEPNIHPNRTFPNAVLREAAKDIEGFYLKVDFDGKLESRSTQIYLYLSERDVRRLIGDWGKLLAPLT